MFYDKEKAKIVVKAIEDDAESPLSKYTFDAFCKKYHLYHDTDKRHGEDVYIQCPFHNDEDPSLGINESRRIFNCLGCSEGGSYLSFVLSYKTKVLGYDMSFYQLVNEILSEDKALQSKVGFSTICIPKKQNTEFTPVKKFKFTAQLKVPSTYPELSTFMLRKNCTKEQIVYACLLMQSGVSALDIYKVMFTSSDKDASIFSSEKHYSLDELSREE